MIVGSQENYTPRFDELLRAATILSTSTTTGSAEAQYRASGDLRFGEASTNGDDADDDQDEDEEEQDDGHETNDSDEQAFKMDS
jgi:hypothetical protein